MKVEPHLPTQELHEAAVRSLCKQLCRLSELGVGKMTHELLGRDIEC